MPEVETRTGMSQRTIYRMVQEGKLRQASRPIPGRRPLPIFHPDDVAAFEEQRVKGGQEILPPDSAMAKRTVNGHSTDSGLLELVRALTVPAHLWLTLQEAVDYSGLPAGTLLEFLLSGRLPAIDVGRRRRGGRWRIRQVDLRKLNAIPLEPHYKVLAESEKV
jgi:predicted site-specific integrase-resolvase